MSIQTVDSDTLGDRAMFLSQTQLFGSLTQGELTHLARDLIVQTYARDDVVFYQGDENDDLFVVRQGRVRVYCVSPGGSELSLNILSPGDIVGEFAAVDTEPRSATVQAIEECTLYQLSRAAFLRHLREMPSLALSLLRLLVDKLRWTTTYAEAIALYDAQWRLLHILLYYHERYGRPGRSDNESVLDLGLNQEGLASLVGVRRERMTRILGNLRSHRVVEYAAGEITILDLEKATRLRDTWLDERRRELPKNPQRDTESTEGENG